MKTATLSKTDFIKFNVNPTFKALAQKKAAAHGMSLSELGRMLFGAFVTDHAAPRVSKELLRMAEEAKAAHRQGKGILFTNVDDMATYFDKVK